MDKVGAALKTIWNRSQDRRKVGVEKGVWTECLLAEGEMSAVLALAKELGFTTEIHQTHETKEAPSDPQPRSSSKSSRRATKRR